MGRKGLRHLINVVVGTENIEVISIVAGEKIFGLGECGDNFFNIIQRKFSGQLDTSLQLEDLAGFKPLEQRDTSKPLPSPRYLGGSGYNTLHFANYCEQ